MRVLNQCQENPLSRWHAQPFFGIGLMPNPRKKKGGGDVLRSVVQGEGKVLPVLKVDGRRPKQVGVAAQKLPRLLVGPVGADAVASVEVELVGAVVGGLVPDVLRRGEIEVSWGSANFKPAFFFLLASRLTRYSWLKLSGF